MQNRTQPYELQKMMCHLVEYEHKPFSTFNAMYSVLTYAESYYTPGVSIQSVQPLPPAIERDLRHKQIIKEDVDLVKQWHHRNNQLLRDTLCALINKNSISIYQAMDEILAVLAGKPQRYNGTYQADLKKARINCIDRGNVFDPYHLAAMHAMISISQIDPEKAFGKVLTSPGKVIQAIPHVVVNTLTIIKNVAVELIPAGCRVDNLLDELKFMMANKTSHYVYNGAELIVQDLDLFYIENMFTPNFKEELLYTVEVARIRKLLDLDLEAYSESVLSSVKSGNAEALLQTHIAAVECVNRNNCDGLLQQPAIARAVRVASQKNYLQANPEILNNAVNDYLQQHSERLTPAAWSPEFLLQASNHVTENSDTYMMGASVLVVLVLLYALRDTLKAWNPFRPLTAMYGLLFKPYNENKKNDNRTSTEGADPEAGFLLKY